MIHVDRAHMRRALVLAEQARGLTSPNPMVGAVLVKDGTVVGEGFHHGAGQAHAEVLALEAAGEWARGATLYVTLEPCAHQGRTPPCAPQVIAAGVRRVVAAVEDPNPLVVGRGLAALRAAGVEVIVGVLAEESERLNRAFVTAMRQARPHVTLKVAMTLDGKIADVHRGSRWITGEAARAVVHRLRAEADAVLVGAGTVRQDDPALNVRLEPSWPREPYRIVLDTAAGTDPGARLISVGTPGRAVIAVGEGAPTERVERLRAAGATVLILGRRDGRVDLGALLVRLHALEMRSILVEGGSEVHAAFLEAGVVDRAAMFVAPMLLGGRDAPSVVGGAGRELEQAVRLGPLSVTRLGEDLLLEADVRGSG